MRNIILIFCIFFSNIISIAKPTEKESVGVGVYYGTRNDSPETCRNAALEMARIEAIREAFGTIISQSIQSFAIENNGKSDNKFLSLSSSDVCGEWLKDLSEPKFEVEYNSNNTLTVTCRVKILCRELVNECPSFRTETLRGVPDKKYAATEYNDGDDIYLWFSPSADGFIQVYLADESGMVAGILPYDGSEIKEVRVKGGEEYIFFSKATSPIEFGQAKRYQAYTEQSVEFNKLYVMFSTEPFAPPIMKKPRRSLPPMLTIKDFTEWRVQNQRRNPKLGIIQLNIKINS